MSTGSGFPPRPVPGSPARPRTFLGRPYVRDGRKSSGTTKNRPGRHPPCPGRPTLQADLIGPYDPDTGHEVLRLPPLRWYLTGFLVPVAGALIRDHHFVQSLIAAWAVVRDELDPVPAR